MKQHPEVSFPKVGTEELHFFDEANPLYTAAWYFNQFEQNTAVGEFTPNYIRVPEPKDRTYDLLGPDIKFIVALRNPVDRANGHYWQQVDRVPKRLYRLLHDLSGESAEALSFERMLELEEGYPGDERYTDDLALFKTGLYAEHLKWYFERFSWDSFYIFLLEDFVKDPGTILAVVCRFLSVNDTFSFAGLDRRVNAHARQSLAKATNTKLLRRYKSSIEELQDLLGRSLAVWEESAA